MITPEELEVLRNKVIELKLEHRDLDDIVTRMQQDLTANHLLLQRLKKRKLLLKDMIAKLESKMIPDLNA